MISIMQTATVPRIVRYRDGQVMDVDDDLAREEPLEIRVRGRAISVTMRTPDHDDELAAGFLLSEGLIHRREDVLSIEPCDRNDAGNLLNVTLAPEVPVDFEKLTRHVFASSSCGLCGKATIDAVKAQFPSLITGTIPPPPGNSRGQLTADPSQSQDHLNPPGDFSIDPNLLVSLPALMRQK